MVSKLRELTLPKQGIAHPSTPPLQGEHRKREAGVEEGGCQSALELWSGKGNRCT